MKAMTGVLDNLMFLSKTRNLLYITDTNVLVPTRKFEHLSCFFPGLLALGAETLPESVMSAQQKELHLWAAEGLAHTCWVMYADQPSGLGPEVVMFEGWGQAAGPTWPPQPNEDWKQERWMRHVEAWEMGGRQGGKPPGVGDAGMPVKKEQGVMMDYMIWTPSYLLRPEVSTCMVSLLLELILCPDPRVDVRDVSHDERRQVARAWVADLGGHRGQDAHWQRLCKRLRR
jgi:hypothetical protein